jgi:spore coat polysaccharide biosynthesis protein SpsF (cytidylyltransferase family)/RimJ/RimL family protein N-acetyltransferase
MTVTCVIQARVGSTRLPGKVLADLGGRPLLAFMLERLRDLPVEHLLVATSDLPADDPIARLCATTGVPVFRGSHDDVLGRFAASLDAFPADTLVRLTGDCPLVDPEIVTGALELSQRTGADYTSNTLIRTFPDGLDVEVVTAAALREAATAAVDPIEREHVTPYLYRRPERFRLAALRCPDLLGDERWTVDTAADLELVRTIVAALAPETKFGWRRALEIAGRRHIPGAEELALRPATWADAGLLLEWRNDADSIRFSKSGIRVAPDQHERWLRARLECPCTRIWIATVGDLPVGTVRVDVSDGVGLVSLAVAPPKRGRGYATLILEALQRALSADYQVRELTADVHRENPASQRVFASAGFRPADDEGCFRTWRWIREATQHGNLVPAPRSEPT